MRSRRVVDLWWRLLAVLLECLSWVAAGLVVQAALSDGRPWGQTGRGLFAFLILVVIWQLALGGAGAGPLPRPVPLCRRQVTTALLVRGSAGAIGLALLAGMGASAAVVGEAVLIGVVAAAFGLAGLWTLCRLRGRLICRHQQLCPSVIVYGARGLGRQCVEAIRRERRGESARIAFVDDDPALRWREVCGCPVIGSGAELPRLAHERGATRLVIAFANPAPGQVRDLQRVAASVGAELSAPRRVDESRVVWTTPQVVALQHG